MEYKNKLLMYLFTLTCCFFSTLTSSEESLVSDNFIKRHSGTSFDPSRFLDNMQINALITAAKWTPSSFNDQPWNFIICDLVQTPEAYEKALASIYESQRDWVHNAPVLIVVVVRTKYSYNDEVNEWAEYDTGAATFSMSLQATDLELMTHQLGGFDSEFVRKAFQIPEDYKPIAIMAVGYETADAEPQQRERLPVGKNFFLGEWGSGVSDS